MQIKAQQANGLGLARLNNSKGLSPIVVVPGCLVLWLGVIKTEEYGLQVCTGQTEEVWLWNG